MLLATPTVARGRSVPWQLTFTNDTAVNAFSTAGGKVYVTRGLTPFLGDDLGSWAAVLGHEMGHVLLQHQYKAYLRNLELQQQKNAFWSLAMQGNKVAQWGLVGVAVGGGLINLKYSRDDELAADHVGLMLMAQAGIHPDFAIALYRRMRERMGDTNRVSTFLFFDHPRWATREARLESSYGEALDIFKSHWANAADSPGGAPPEVATIGSISVAQDREQRAATIEFPVDIRNAPNTGGEVVVRFLHKGDPVPSALPDYQLQDGALGVIRPFAVDSADQSFDLALAIPSKALEKKWRTLDAVIQVKNGNEELGQSQPFRVTFPKL
jgi:Peptidase family M48